MNRGCQPRSHALTPNLLSSFSLLTQRSREGVLAYAASLSPLTPGSGYRDARQSVRQVWVQSDSCSVVRLLTDRAPLVPHHAAPPAAQRRAIRRALLQEARHCLRVRRLVRGHRQGGGAPQGDRCAGVAAGVLTVLSDCRDTPSLQLSSRRHLKRHHQNHLIPLITGPKHRFMPSIQTDSPLVAKDALQSQGRSATTLLPPQWSGAY
jgi:hypothetical protein